MRLAAAFALLFSLACARFGDLHICGNGTHRETRVGFSVDERWCERGSGVKHGLYTAWHVTGGEGVRLEGAFEEGRRARTWRRWDDAGQLRWMGAYRNGLPHETWTYWHPNGERWKRGAFRDGKREGPWTFWDRDGEVVEQVGFEAGALVGPPARSGDDSLTRPGLRTLAGVRFSFPLDCGGSLHPIAVGDLAIAACSTGKLAREPGPARVYAVDLRSGREVWRLDLPPAKVSFPSSDGESVYLAAGEELLALNAETGEPWLRFDMPGRANAFSTVARDDDSLYFTAYRAGLYALDLETRSLRWRYPVPRSANAPLVLSGDVLLARIGATPGLHAIDAASGAARWTFAAEGGSRGAVAADGGTVYHGSRDGLHAVDLESGAERWAFRAAPWIKASPAVSEELVLAASFYGELYALERDSGRERWRFATRGMVEHAVQAAGDVVLVRSRNGLVYALDSASGDELWRFDTRTSWGSPPIPGPGVVVFASADGFLTALE